MTELTLPNRRDRIAALAYDYQAEPKAHRECCNLCGNDVFITVAHRDRYFYPARAQSCRECSLTFLNPVMTSEAYGGFIRTSIGLSSAPIMAGRSMRLPSNTSSATMQQYSVGNSARALRA